MFYYQQIVVLTRTLHCSIIISAFLFYQHLLLYLSKNHCANTNITLFYVHQWTCCSNKTIPLFYVHHLIIALSTAECNMMFLVHPSNASVAEQVDFVFNCTILELTGHVQWTKGGFGLGIDRELEGFERYSMVGSERRGRYSRR